MTKSLFISGREINYPRNSLFLSALREFCDVDAIGSEKLNVSKGGVLSILVESLKAIFKSLPKLYKENYDFIFIGFFGQLLIFPISLLSNRRIVFDVFISTYDTLVNDRGKFSKNSLVAKLAYYLDKQSCQMADLILIDTQTHAQYFNSLFDTPLEKMQSIYVGCDEQIFYPRNTDVNEGKILYYCSYMPLHGVDTVVTSARLLQDRIPVRFKLIGEGVEFPKILKIVNDQEIKNIDFSPSIPLRDLPGEIAEASICLGGHFGNSQKSKNVISGKTFQMLAMRKPVIVGDNPANKELLTHSYDAYFCEMNNPDALADAIETLYHDQKLKKVIGDNGYRTYMDKASQEVLKRRVIEIISDSLLQK